MRLNARNGVGYANRNQTAAGAESGEPDARDRVRDVHRYQAAAGTESIISEANDRIRNAHRRLIRARDTRQHFPSWVVTLIKP